MAKGVSARGCVYNRSHAGVSRAIFLITVFVRWEDTLCFGLIFLSLRDTADVRKRVFDPDVLRSPSGEILSDGAALAGN